MCEFYTRRILSRFLFLLLLLSPPVYAKYDEAVTLPPCDFLIQDKHDWARINDPSYNVFCVTPAVYTRADIGVVTLLRSGSPDKPRYLRWFDPENPDDTDTHVVDIPRGKQAVISQFYLAGSYWVIDRLILRDGRGANKLDGGASHNVLNRMLIEGGAATLLLRFNDSHDNVLQNSVLRDTVIKPGRDSYVVYLNKSEGERIVNNEIYNYGGGIQQGPASLGNHVVYGNEFYLTNELYTDCKGNMKRDGACACSEGMSVVLKGVDRPGSEFRIENNLIYGHKRHDRNCMGSGSPGLAIDLGSGGNMTRNVIISGNVILNEAPYNIILGALVENVVIENNVVGYAEKGITNVYGKDVTITGNSYIDNNNNYHSGPKATGTIYRDNRNITAADKDAMCFTVRKFTNPHTLCIPQMGMHTYKEVK